MKRLQLLLVCMAVAALVPGCDRQDENKKEENTEVLPRSEPAGVNPVGRVQKRLTNSPVYKRHRRQALDEGLDVESELDFSSQRQTREGRYRVEITQRPDPLELHEFHSWVLSVEDADGRAVTGADLSVSGGMPEHGHGLPTLPQVVLLDKPGRYRVDGLKFSMPGWWEVHVHVSREKLEDSVTFNLLIE